MIPQPLGYLGNTTKVAASAAAGIVNSKGGHFLFSVYSPYKVYFTLGRMGVIILRGELMLKIGGQQNISS